MQAVVKKVVYSFRYRLGPGQVGREVFHIVLMIASRINFDVGRNSVSQDSIVLFLKISQNKVN